jgi:hypothetical protein
MLKCNVEKQCGGRKEKKILINSLQKKNNSIPGIAIQIPFLLEYQKGISRKIHYQSYVA